MKYALSLNEGKRILSVTEQQYRSDNSVIVDNLPEDDISDYLYVNGEFVYDPIPKSDNKFSVNLLEEQKQRDSDIDAMLVDFEYRLTLLELFSDIDVAV